VEHWEIGGLALRCAPGSNACGVQKFKRSFVPFNCFAVFKKEVQSTIEICIAGIEDRTK